MQLHKKQIYAASAVVIAFATAGYALIHQDQSKDTTPEPDLDALVTQSRAIVAANRAKPCGKDASLVLLRNPNMTCPSVK